MLDEQTDGTHANRGGLSIKERLLRCGLTWIGHERNHATKQGAACVAGRRDPGLYLDSVAVLRCGVLGGHPRHRLRADAAAAAIEVRLAAQPDVAVHPEYLSGDRDFAGDHPQCPAGS